MLAYSFCEKVLEQEETSASTSNEYTLHSKDTFKSPNEAVRSEVKVMVTPYSFDVSGTPIGKRTPSGENIHLDSK